MPILAAVLLLSLGQFGQANTGELRLTVVDASGLALQGAVELVSEANHVSERLETDEQGSLSARRLPFGTYRVSVTRAGFAVGVASRFSVATTWNFPRSSSRLTGLPPYFTEASGGRRSVRGSPVVE